MQDKLVLAGLPFFSLVGNFWFAAQNLRFGRIFILRKIRDIERARGIVIKLWCFLLKLNFECNKQVWTIGKCDNLGRSSYFVTS